MVITCRVDAVLNESVLNANANATEIAVVLLHAVLLLF